MNRSHRTTVVDGDHLTLERGDPRLDGDCNFCDAHHRLRRRREEEERDLDLEDRDWGPDVFPILVKGKGGARTAFEFRCCDACRLDLGAELHRLGTALTQGVPKGTAGERERTR